MRSDGREGKEIRMFLAGNQAPVPDRNRKEADMVLFRERLRELPVSKDKNMWVRLLEQAEYVHPVSWAVQLLAVLTGIWLARGYGGELAIMGISALIPVFTAVGGFEISKAVHYGMWELERSCRYDTRKIAVMKLLLFGLCDLAALTVFSLLVYGEGGSFRDICLRVLMPFTLSAGAYLFFLERFPMRNGNLILACMGCGMTMVQVCFWKWLETGLPVSDTVGAGLILTASFLFLAGAVFRFGRGKEREDEILWNLE